MGDVVAELHVLDALRHEQSHGASRPSGLALAAEDGQPGGGFEATLKADGALDVGTILAAERRLDVATDLVQRRRDRFDIRFTEVGVFSYFCDGNGASHPDRATGTCGRATQRLTPSLGHGDVFTADGTIYPQRRVPA
jgi:hypothetical protein